MTPPAVAHACTCAVYEPQEDALTKADAVFVGIAVGRAEPLRMSPGRAENGRDSVTWVLAVESVTKGDVTSPQRVTSAFGPPACGVDFPDTHLPTLCLN
jgi:hypothetical protein